jgi:hypothetical protein
MVMRLFYLAKRVRPDILLATTFLSTRISKPSNQDRQKLDRIIAYINGTKELCLNFDCSKGLDVIAYVDASFGVHKEFKSHTGSIINLGNNPIHVKSSKQKLNTKSSTEAELVGVSDSLPQIIWVNSFLKSQGYLKTNVKLLQDNMSTISLIKNGKSNAESTRHINIRFFFIHDRFINGEIQIEHIGTANMIADIFTKPLQGDLFFNLRSKLLGTHN